MNELADIARCASNPNPGDMGSVEYVVSCMQDLAEVLQHNKVEARTVETFGKRIAKLLRYIYPGKKCWLLSLPLRCFHGKNSSQSF